jgi:hypothetical protein
LYDYKILYANPGPKHQRKHFADILAHPRRKHIEYRDISECWESRLEKVGQPPFNLRLLNGMTPPIPEATYCPCGESGPQKEYQND